MIVVKSELGRFSKIYFILGLIFKSMSGVVDNIFISVFQLQKGTKQRNK